MCFAPQARTPRPSSTRRGGGSIQTGKWPFSQLPCFSQLPEITVQILAYSPRRDYCSYFHEDYLVFASPEARVLHFVERASNKNWEWRGRWRDSSSPDDHYDQLTADGGPGPGELQETAHPGPSESRKTDLSELGNALKCVKYHAFLVHFANFGSNARMPL